MESAAGGKPRIVLGSQEVIRLWRIVALSFLPAFHKPDGSTREEFEVPQPPNPYN